MFGRSRRKPNPGVLAEQEGRRSQPVWPHAESFLDFYLAVCAPATQSNGARHGPTLALEDIAEVERFYVSWAASIWASPGPYGVELRLAAVFRLRGGAWAAVESWNDHSSGVCQSRAAVHVAGDEVSVVSHGLTDTGRVALRYQAHGD